MLDSVKKMTQSVIFNYQEGHLYSLFDCLSLIVV